MGILQSKERILPHGGALTKGGDANEDLSNPSSKAKSLQSSQWRPERGAEGVHTSTEDKKIRIIEEGSAKEI